MITYKLFQNEDAKKLSLFEAMARETEPAAFLDTIDIAQYEKQILLCKKEAVFQNTHIVLAMENEAVVGRCDFVILGSFMDGGKTGYIDWIYTLRPYRHKGIGQGMVSFMEHYLKAQGVSEYFLITAHNEEAQKFYNRFLNFTKETDWILRKSIE